MKHPLFKGLGDAYPFQLEERYERILIKIENLWDTPEVHDYFSDLLIDSRGGRQGFPEGVMNDIIRLREFRDLETFREAERKEDAFNELSRREVHLTKENFMRALNDGNQELIDLFVRAQFTIPAYDENGIPPLLLALKKGHTIIAKILLDAGAEVNSRDKMGLTPLLIACGKTTHGYHSIAESLISKGAFVNVRDSLGYTPLLLALSGGATEIAKHLIIKGADTLACTKRGETALAMAKNIEGIEGAEIVEMINSQGSKPILGLHN